MLSAAIASLAQDTLIYSARYNVPLHLLEGEDARVPAARAADPVLIHYHWLMQRGHHPALMRGLARLRVGAPVLAWLAEKLAALPPDIATGEAASP